MSKYNVPMPFRDWIKLNPDLKAQEETQACYWCNAGEDSAHCGYCDGTGETVKHVSLSDMYNDQLTADVEAMRNYYNESGSSA